MLSASTLQMKFMQRAAAKRGETATPSPISSPHLGPSTPARSTPGTPSTPGSAQSIQSSVPRPGFGAETQWVISVPSSPSPIASGSGSAAVSSISVGGEKGKQKVRVSYAASYMAFMQDEVSSEEGSEDEGATSVGKVDQPGSRSIGRGRMGFGDFAAKPKTPQTPILITEGLSNGMKPRPPASASPATPGTPSSNKGRGNGNQADLPLNRPIGNLPAHLRQEQSPRASPGQKGKSGGKASPLSRIMGNGPVSGRRGEGATRGDGSPAISGGKKLQMGTQTPPPAPKLNSHGFAKPAGYDDLPTSSSSTAGPSTPSQQPQSQSQRKNKKKRPAPTDDDPNDEVAAAMDEMGDLSVVSIESSTGRDENDLSKVLENGARAAKKAKKNKKGKKKGQEVKGPGQGSSVEDGAQAGDEDDVDRLMREMEAELGEA